MFAKRILCPLRLIEHRDAMSLAPIGHRSHLDGMSNERVFIRPKSPHTATSGHGPIIDQDGREIRPDDAGFHEKGFGGQAFRFDLGQGGANPFQPLTREQRVARLEAIAQLLDVAFVVPGTKIRYGIDGLIGLIPVVGDIITTAISLWLVREARALGAPWHITARMLGNVAIDGAVGIVPFVGDAFDVMFRANIRNIKMLRTWLDKQPRL
jgi:hypothetical protein